MVGVRAWPVTDDQIVASYEATRSIKRTAKTFAVSKGTVHRVLLKRGVPRDGLSYWRNSTKRKLRGMEKEIRRVYEKGATYKQLQERFGPTISEWSFKQALRRAGATLRENPAQLERPGEIARIKQLSAAGKSTIAISLALGRSQSFVWRLMRKKGIRPNKKLSERFGPEHSMWKGGRYSDHNGYVRAWVPRDDPFRCMALNSGHVLEHRLVMARHLGRPLRRDETIHHVNGDRADNRLENLQIRNGKHGKGKRLRCRCCGSFDLEEVEI